MAKRRLSIPLAPAIGAMFGAAAATLVAATPTWLFEQTVVASGLSEVLSVAQPPLGTTARALAMIFAFIVVAGIMMLAVRMAERGVKPRNRPASNEADDTLDLDPFVEPVAHRIRRPIFADRELGAPFMSDEVLMRAEPDIAPDAEVERETAVESQSLVSQAEPASATDPIATEVDLPELHEPLTYAEFDVTDEAGEAPEDTSLAALVRRLEAGMARRGAPPPGGAPATLAVVPGSGASAFDTADGDRGRPSQMALATLRRMVAA